MAKVGRPPVYSGEERDEIMAHVLTNVASGRYVSRVFREDKTTSTGVKLPHVATFWLWVFESKEYGDKLARAREAGVEAKLDECEEIADDAINDFMEVNYGEDRRIEYRAEHVQRSKLRIETRIKLAQMLKPKTYGPKLDLTSDGERISLPQRLDKARDRLAEQLKEKK